MCYGGSAAGLLLVGRQWMQMEQLPLVVRRCNYLITHWFMVDA